MLDIINLNTNIKFLEKELLKLTRSITHRCFIKLMSFLYNKLIANGELQKNTILWSIIYKMFFHDQIWIKRCNTVVSTFMLMVKNLVANIIVITWDESVKMVQMLICLVLIFLGCSKRI